MKNSSSYSSRADLGVFDFNEEIDSVPTKWTPKCSSGCGKPKFTDSVADKYSFLQHDLGASELVRVEELVGVAVVKGDIVWGCFSCFRLETLPVDYIWIPCGVLVAVGAKAGNIDSGFSASLLLFFDRCSKSMDEKGRVNIIVCRCKEAAVDIDAIDIDNDDCRPDDEDHPEDVGNCPADIVQSSPAAISLEDHAADMIKCSSSGIPMGQSASQSLGELTLLADLGVKVGISAEVSPGNTATGSAVEESPLRNDSDGAASSDVVDNSEESSHSTPTSVLMENTVATDRLSSFHSYHDVEMKDADTTVLLDADYVSYRNRYCPASSLLFSSSSFKIVVFRMQEEVENSQSEWNLDDIVSIWSQWSSKTGTATIGLDISIGEICPVGDAPSVSDTEELEAVIHDPNWLQTQAKIMSLNLKYKDLWITKPNIDRRYERETLPMDSVYRGGPYFPDFDEHCQEVIYPEGDADAVSISKRDVDLLLPETFVNDTIIDFYIKYLKNKIPAEEIHRFHFFNSFFFRKLADLDKNPSSVFEGKAAFQRVRKWTRKIDLFGKDYIFIPVNYNLHWSLIVICHPGEVVDFEEGEMSKHSRFPCILHMDSIRGSHTGLRNLIQSYLLGEWNERQKEASEDVEPKFLNLRFLSLELPQQENCYDCGLFLLHYVELFVAEAPVELNPFKITKFSNFLSSDWFFPSEVSLKRAYIQRLICDLLQSHARADPNTPCGHEHQSSELPETSKNDTGIDLVSNRKIQRNVSGDSLYDLSRPEIRMDVLTESSLRDCDATYGGMREVFEAEAYNLGSCSRLANAASHAEEVAEADEVNPFMSMKIPSIPEYINMRPEAASSHFSYQYADLGAGISCYPEISDDESEGAMDVVETEEAEDMEEADDMEDAEGPDDVEEADEVDNTEEEDVVSPISDYNSDNTELRLMEGDVDGLVSFSPDEDGHSSPLRDDVDHVAKTSDPCDSEEEDVLSPVSDYNSEDADEEDVLSPVSDYNSDGPELRAMEGAVEGPVSFDPDEDGHTSSLRDDVNHVTEASGPPCEVRIESSATEPDVGQVPNVNDEGYPSHSYERLQSICEPDVHKNKRLMGAVEHLIVDDSSSDSVMLHVAKRLRLSPPANEEPVVAGCEAGGPLV
ncbi:putative ubiquitin-like-specific protease 2B [Drosera capensis]